jgi:hypothetical protein
MRRFVASERSARGGCQNSRPAIVGLFWKLYSLAIERARFGFGVNNTSLTADNRFNGFNVAAGEC